MAKLPDVTGVIVADDDSLIRSVVRARLEAIGVTVFLASDGLEAVDLASRMKASVIMLDIAMPKLNGLDACKRIRRLPGNADTPIVILTSTQAKGIEEAAERVGATTFLHKPFGTAQLLMVLSRFLPISQDTRQTIKRNAERANEIAQGPVKAAAAEPAAKSGWVDPLDRDKKILAVLRR